ncbi:MAG: tryptophan--tRNA ligase [Candidatus Pacearchaeota archaeon]
MTKTEEGHVDPWEVKGKVDYGRLMKEFGIKPLPLIPEEFYKNILFRRGVVFAHRDFDKTILSCLKRDKDKSRKPFVMMTGLMPTGKFHLGHMLLAQQMIFYQNLGAKLYIAVADLEAYTTRGQSLDESKKIAIDEYITNYIALGLKPENCEIYFQSERSHNAKKANAYYRLASNFSKHATFNEFKAVYGDISPGKMSASLLQSSDMYHPQLPEFEGEKNPEGIPTFIPVGVDQDPHIRIARDMAGRFKEHKFIQIASTYHLFMPGLSGGKMSSSEANSFIAMTDSAKEVETKIKKYAFSGGRDTLEEHRKKGGNPDIDVSFQYLKMFFEPDDKKLSQIEKDYRSGKMLTSELKEYLIKKINDFLAEHQKKREKAKKMIDSFLYKN